MKKNNKDLKGFVIVLVFILCVLSLLFAQILVPAIVGILLILGFYLSRVLTRMDVEQKKLEIEELLLLSLFFSFFAIYSMASYMKVGSGGALLFLVIFASCLVLLDILKGLNIFISSRKREIFFRERNPQSKNKILFLGDSIITNQGVHNPSNSIGELFLKKYPDVDITSIAINGGTTKDLLKFIKEEKDRHYRVAVISIGGNDIVSFMSLKKLKSNLFKIIDRVAEIADHTIFIFSYDIGRAPFFSRTILASIFSGYFNIKSERLVEILLELKQTKKFLLLNLNDPSLGEESIKNLYDTDFLHPNEKGYLYLFEQITSLLKEKC